MLEDILHSVGEGAGDYGIDNVGTSEMRVYHSDLVSPHKGLSIAKSLWTIYRSFVWIFVVELKILLKSGKHTCCIKHN